MLVLMLPEWRTPTGWGIWAFALSAGIGAVAQLLITEAFRLGEVSLLAPIQYTSLLWAGFFGYAIFGNVPTTTLLIGAAVIVASTLYIVQRRGPAGARPRQGARKTRSWVRLRQRLSSSSARKVHDEEIVRMGDGDMLLGACVPAPPPEPSLLLVHRPAEAAGASPPGAIPLWPSPTASRSAARKRTNA